MRKTALITGASRGIGRVIANTLAQNGYNIVVTGKTVEPNDNLPGTIYNVRSEIKQKYKTDVIALPLDIRDYDQMKNVVDKTISHFGNIDILVNNAGALWWKSITDTSESKYDLINDINTRGSFLLSQLCLPHMERNNYGHIIMHSPPLLNPSDINIFNNKTAYMISKYGMTMTAMGISAEYKNKNIAANTIWPSTPIESSAVRNNKFGDEKMWRKPSIIADSILKIVNEEPNTFTGNQLIDEDYLRSIGVEDFSKYQCISGYEAPKLNDVFNKFNK